jgi:hypothetical protein
MEFNLYIADVQTPHGPRVDIRIATNPPLTPESQALASCSQAMALGKLCAGLVRTVIEMTDGGVKPITDASPSTTPVLGGLNPEEVAKVMEADKHP